MVYNLERRYINKYLGLSETKLLENGKKLQNAELHALYSLHNIIRNRKSKGLIGAGHVAHIEQFRKVYRILLGKPEGKRPLRRPRHIWENNIKMDFREVACDAGVCIDLSQDRDDGGPV